MLAGDLIIDIPYTRKNLNRRQWRLVIEIFKQLAETACSVQLPDNAILYGWPDGRRPDNADAFVNNNEVKAQWCKTRTPIVIRFDPTRYDGKAEIDEEALRQMGIIKVH